MLLRNYVPHSRKARSLRKGASQVFSISQSRKTRSSSSLHTTAQATEVSQGKSNVRLCAFCKEEHSINRCKAFADLPVKQRRAHAQSSRLCYNCLGSGHSVESCSSKGRCLTCQAKHHTRLHIDNVRSSRAHPPAPENQQNMTEQSTSALPKRVPPAWSP